jgi:tetratricopeptide (TPR) repeat protein
MRGTISEPAYNAYTEAMRSFPIASNSRFQSCMRSLHQALAEDSNYPRAKALMSYAYVTKLIEGWTFEPTTPEESWSDATTSQQAENLADAAIIADPSDYEGHWAKAFYFLHNNQQDKAIEKYDRAIYLNRTDNNRNLLAEAADAYVYVGQLDKAIELIRASLAIPDWHRWVAAWVFFCKSRTDGTYLDLAADQLRKMRMDPEEDNYPADAQLLFAVVQAKRSGASTNPFAERFLRRRQGWTRETERRRTPFSSSLASQVLKDYWEASIDTVQFPDQSGP